MAYVVEMPPVVIQEIQDYERATGRSLEARVVEFIKNELRRRREAAYFKANPSRVQNELPRRVNKSAPATPITGNENFGQHRFRSGYAGRNA